MDRFCGGTGLHLPVPIPGALLDQADLRRRELEQPIDAGVEPMSEANPRGAALKPSL